MTLVQLRYLVAIVDAGLNISVAAQNTHSTQPGLSKQLGQIEEELGFKVFTRRGKRLEVLTDAGREVIDRAKIILAETASIQALAASRRKEARGELRIATTLTQARYVLPETLTVLRAKFPDVTLHISAFGESEALERVDQDTADLAIVSSAEPPRTQHLAIPLYRWELIGLAHPDHPLARHSTPIGPGGSRRPAADHLRVLAIGRQRLRPGVRRTRPDPGAGRHHPGFRADQEPGAQRRRRRRGGRDGLVPGGR